MHLTKQQSVRCVVCGGTSDRVVLRDNGYEGRACSCGTIYTSPEPPQHSIDPLDVGHADGFYDVPASLKARWVRKRVRGDRLLEVGCGTGAFLAAAQAVGFDVEGLEPSKERATVAQDRVAGRIHQCLLEDFDPDSQRYDVVFHCDMLAHFVDPHEALTKMASLLTSNGVLAFEVGLVGGLQPYWYRQLGSIGYPQHRWLYSEASLRRLLRQSGLRIRATTRFDLSLCIALGQCMRRAANLRNVFSSRGRQAVRRLTPPPSGKRTPISARLWYLRLESFLRYRAGAILPRLGPGTMLVIAQPVPNASSI